MTDLPSADTVLGPAAVAAALELAQTLYRAAGTLEELASGRNRAAQTVLAGWAGPLQHRFAQQLNHERGLAAAAEQALRDESARWTQFWADAVNDGNDQPDRQARLHRTIVGTPTRPSHRRS